MKRCSGMKFIGMAVVLSLLILTWKGQAVAGNFDWEPFKAKSDFFQPIDPDSATSVATYSSFQNFEDYLFSFNGDGIPSEARKALELQFDFRNNVKFSISRFAFNADRDHTAKLTDLEKQRQDLIDSLASSLQGPSIPKGFETIGKIFQPNINLHIEF